METFQLALIDGPFLKNCDFKTKEIIESDNNNIECGYALGVTVGSEGENKYVAINASVSSDSDNIPFSFNVRVEARFGMDGLSEDITGSDEFEKESISQAWPYLFTFLKEVVADLTRKSSVRPFLLPAIDLDLQKVGE